MERLRLLLLLSQTMAGSSKPETKPREDSEDDDYAAGFYTVIEEGEKPSARGGASAGAKENVGSEEVEFVLRDVLGARVVSAASVVVSDDEEDNISLSDADTQAPARQADPRRECKERQRDREPFMES